jgi:F-type H+-transporting ATPase subunit a
MLSGTETEAVRETGAHAAEHAEAAFDPGSSILHHILDSSELEVFVPSIKIPLPHIELFGLDVSITKHVVMMWLAALVLIVLTRVAVRQCREPVPRGIRNAFEVLVVFIRDEVGMKSIGPGFERYVPYLLTTFFFILTCNLLGLVPGAATATGNISVTAALAVIAFVVIQLGGIAEYGVIKHFKNLVPHGLPLWLVPIMFLLELLSTFIKPFALCIRLFANMMAGHVVILAFITLIFIMGAMFSPIVGIAASPLAVFFALFVYLLEILVAFLQAYIFTMLTANFIGMAVHPAH